MPIIAKALLEKRAAYERWAERMGLDELIEKHPDAAGYLRDRDGYRLFERRDGLIEELKQRLRATSGLAKQPQHHPSTP
jgi:deoxyhypusine synthase